MQQRLSLGWLRNAQTTKRIGQNLSKNFRASTSKLIFAKLRKNCFKAGAEKYSPEALLPFSLRYLVGSTDLCPIFGSVKKFDFLIAS